MDSLGYYGLSLQVGDFGLDIYLTQLIFGIVEVPARYSSIFLMQWLGRKWSQLGALVLGGLMSISITFIPAGNSSSLQLLCPHSPSEGSWDYKSGLRVYGARVQRANDLEGRGPKEWVVSMSCDWPTNSLPQICP